MSDRGDMTARYEAYLAAFNAKDFAGLGLYVSPDVVFDWNGEMPTMHGSAAMFDFYREAWTHLNERVSAGDIEVVGASLRATITNELHVFRDWPECPLGPMRAGPPYTISGRMEYLFSDGRIIHIAER
jgi:hypothetical protein